MAFRVFLSYSLDPAEMALAWRLQTLAAAHDIEIHVINHANDEFLDIMQPLGLHLTPRGNRVEPREIRVRRTTDSDCQGVQSVRLVDRPQHVRRPAAGGNAAKYIARTKAQGFQIANPDRRIVLRCLRRA